jgi:peptidoglycan/LPS O-acetylase OafA/YrhL
VKTNRQGKFNDIQWLRAVAAIEVVAWHSDLVTKHFSAFSMAGVDWYRPLGGVGVEIFFIVSGYVMCLRLPTYRSGAQFLAARFLRLAPMYWLFTSLVVLAYIAHPSWRLNALDLDADSIIRSYLMLPQQRYPILGVGWTLEIEMMFYVQLALALAICTALLRPVGNTIVYVLVAAGLVGFALGTGPNGRTWDYHLVSPYMLMFAFGWIMCSIERRPVAGGRRGVYAAAALVWLAALAVADPDHRHLLGRMAAAAAVFVSIHALRPVLQRDIFVNRVGSMLGDASYSLYLSHWFVLSALGKALGALHLPAGLDLLTRGGGTVAAVVFAVVCFRCVEKPLDRLLRPGVRSRAGPAPAEGLTQAAAFVLPREAARAAPNVMSPPQPDTARET